MNNLLCSTRNAGSGVLASQAVLDGIAPDGGLYWPKELPRLTAEDIAQLRRKDYRGRAARILSLLLGDYSEEELERYSEEAYSTEKFGGADTAPLRRLDDNTFVLELWHGPTAAFKDMALQMLPRLLRVAFDKSGEKRRALILTATSGDTGKAALEGFADVEGTGIMVFYPTDGVSAVQKLQMTTQRGNNVFVSGIYGNFDDAQTGVKRIFADPEARKALDEKGVFLTSANSINWGRLAPQVVYYISAYCDMLERGWTDTDKGFNVCVPTGNFGDILSAYIAKRMGLPIDRLICASNSNRVLADFIATGRYDARREFFRTVSPSMDILVSSNVERMLFAITEGDGESVSGWMNRLTREGYYTLDEATALKLKDTFVGGWCDEVSTAETVRRMYYEKNYLADTHTAVGGKVLEDYRTKTGDDRPCLLASTANPYKFADSVLGALTGERCEASLETVMELERLTGVCIPDPIKELAGARSRFTGSVIKEDMLQQVMAFAEEMRS